jgi:hypothetical protein
VAARSQAWAFGRQVCWDRGFESHRRNGCLCLVSVCVLSGRGLCDGLITRPEESYRVVGRLTACDLETSKRRRPRPDLGCCATGKTYRRRMYFWIHLMLAVLWCVLASASYAGLLRSAAVCLRVSRM